MVVDHIIHFLVDYNKNDDELFDQLFKQIECVKKSRL